MSDHVLTGWGRTAPSRADVMTVSTVEQVLDAVTSAGRRGLLARGRGRSYGDAAQNAGGKVLDLTELALPKTERDRVVLDPSTGVAQCSAGLSLDELIRASLSSGWFPAVTPGTRWVSIGGAVAADVHGKNHHADGSIAQFVRSLTLVTPAHGPITVSPARHPEVFWATVGGMGLTGVITEVEMQLLDVSSAYMDVDTDRCGTLDDLLRQVQEHEQRRRYTVAWVDVLSSHGRGVVTSADHRPGATAYPGGRQARVPIPVLEVPVVAPPRLLNRASVSLFNEAWFRRAPRHARNSQESLWRFFYPLDGVAGWNRLYGPSGLVQYQVVVPDSGTLRAIVDKLRQHRAPVFLAVLKTFGTGNQAPLSFPRNGWTLAVDLPRDTPGLAPLLDGLDELTVAAGGRTYLAKDSRVRPELVPLMYPELSAWTAVRDAVDPGGVMTSDLSRRLGL